jgi:hypothetical protein
MNRLPVWAIWSMIPGAAVLAPVLAFVLAVAAAIILGALREAGVPAVLALAAASIGGRLLIRNHRVPWFGAGAALTASEIGRSAPLAKPIADNITPFPGPASRHRGAQ